MVASRQTLSDRFAHTICKHHARIVSEHRVSNRRLDTYPCGTPSDDQVLDPQFFENRIQVGLIEAAVAMLVDDNIAGLWLQFRDNIRVPCVANQNSALRTIRSEDCLSNAEAQVSHPIRRVGSAQVREIRAKPIFR